MKRVILKSALVTVGALTAIGILIFSLWILISPQSMATVSEKIGNYSFAVTCADLKYKYSGKTEDLARGAEDGILSGDDGLIVKYCQPLIEKQDFEKLCIDKNEDLSQGAFGIYRLDYESFILGNLAASQYREGDLLKAVETCSKGEYQCYNRLVIAVAESGSAEDLETLKSAPSDLGAKEYVNGLIALFVK